MTPTPHGQVPEALRIADEFKLCSEYDSKPSIIDIEKAEAELRRLHAENVTLQQGYDAARLEIDSLQSRVQELGAMLRGICNRRIVELEAQLEAIGAGGVEPLRRRECLHKISEPETAAKPPAGWWRQRADEIELEVAQGKSSAMRCYTDMRALLQAAAGPEEEPAPAAQGDAEDAARYRWLRDVGDATWVPFRIRTGYSAAQVDEAIDAAINADRAKAKQGANHD